MSGNIKRILRDLKKGLAGIYGDRLKAVVLYGSYARGDAHPPDSDIDVLIILAGDFNYWEMDTQSSEFIASLSLKNDMVIARKFVSDTEYSNSKMPLLINVRKEGVVV